MFTEHSYTIPGFYPAACSGIAVSDLDGDGRFEFFICCEQGPNRVLKWTGSQFRDVAHPMLADTKRQAIGAAAADFDGDGREELYVLNAASSHAPKYNADRLFDRLADGSWVDLFETVGNRPLQNRSPSRCVTAVDRRGTARYGFFVTNLTESSRYYEMSPNGLLADVAPALGVDLTAGSQGAWAGPLLSSRMDIVCVNGRGPHFLFANNGSGRFTNVASTLGLADTAEQGHGIVALDANADGYFDLCWGNWEGPHRLMVREAGRPFRNRTSPAMAYPSPAGTIIAADFDNDGQEELFFNCYGEPNRLFGRCPTHPGEWVMRDAGAAVEPDGYGTGAVVADIDGDGRLELLIAHAGNEDRPLSLYRGPVNNHHWLRVLPLTRYGAPARGASVALVAGGKQQIRVLDAGSGFGCQMEPVAHFGLGTSTRVDTVTVTWPDGSALTLETPAIRRTLTVPYPHG